MSDTTIVNPNATCSHNPLASVVVGLIRALSMERDAHESTKVVLHEAVTMMGEQDRQLDRERASRLHLLAQYRELVSGRTKGDERQSDRDDVDIVERRQAA
jgi:hypothetical protein